MLCKERYFFYWLPFQGEKENGSVILFAVSNESLKLAFLCYRKATKANFLGCFMEGGVVTNVIL